MYKAYVQYLQPIEICFHFFGPNAKGDDERDEYIPDENCSHSTNKMNFPTIHGDMQLRGFDLRRLTMLSQVVTLLSKSYTSDKKLN